jgi:rhodanese-related sulfurtransferase
MCLYYYASLVEAQPTVSDEALRRCTILSMEAPPRRTSNRTSIEQLLEHARASLQRMTATELEQALHLGDAVVLDTRTPTDRDRFGCIPGSIHAPRTLIEFMIDPEWGYQHPAIQGFDQRLVCVCNGGFSSSLAARTLQQIGFHRATDLIGGFDAWKHANLPTVEPDHLQFD